MYVNLDFETDLYLDLGFDIDHNLGHHVDNANDIVKIMAKVGSILKPKSSPGPG